MFYPHDIKAIRERLGMTPAQFAAKLKVSPSTICLWEKGLRRPKFTAMESLASLDTRNGHAKRQLVGSGAK